MFKSILKEERDMFEIHVEDLTRKQITLIANCYALVNFKKLCAPLKALFCEDRDRKGYHIRIRVCRSHATVDGEFERSRTGAVFTKGNNVGKFFCGFPLLEKGPDHT